MMVSDICSESQKKLKSCDPINHALQLNPFDIFIKPFYSLNPEDVVAKIKTLKSSLLTKQDNHDTACPIKTLT